MKKYITPDLERIYYLDSDVITTSDTLATTPEVDEGEGEWSDL